LLPALAVSEARENWGREGSRAGREKALWQCFIEWSVIWREKETAKTGSSQNRRVLATGRGSSSSYRRAARRAMAKGQPDPSEKIEPPRSEVLRKEASPAGRNSTGRGKPADIMSGTTV